MRTKQFPIQTYSRTLASATIPEAQVIIPDLGPLQGLYMYLTVTLAGATASQASNTIDNTISTFTGQDQAGEILLNVHGATDLLVLNDILQPRGVRTSPGTITTNSAGAGSATWSFFLPFTVSAKGMPAKLNLTWNPVSSLQNGSLTSAGTVTVSLKVSGAYSTATDQPSLRVRATAVPYATGDNYIQQYLPNGEIVEALAFYITGGDGDFSYVTLTAGGQFLLNMQDVNQFTQQDTMLMQSGHLSGEFICRVPVFQVDSTTTFDVNESTGSAITLYTISTAAQQRAS
jgi:hypothetical protein